MRWDIRPLDGLGPLRLGMSSKQVAVILNPIHTITARDRAFDGSTNEFRGLEVPVCNYVDDKLHGIDTGPRVRDVYIDDIDVYKSSSNSILTLFGTKNGGAKYGLGMVLFEKISINTTGFFEKRKGFLTRRKDGEDERGVGVFVADAFASVLHDFENIDLKKYR